MLDIRFIRENKELIELAAKKKRVKFDVGVLLKIDDDRRTLLASIEKKRAEQNEFSSHTAEYSGDARAALLTKMKALKESMQDEEEKLSIVVRKWRKFMLEVPNIPDMTVPEGDNEEDNRELKTWGNKPSFDFAPKNHIDICESLDLADFVRGTEVSGFRGYFLKNEGATLSFALWQYALSFFSKKGGFVPMIVPSLVRQETLLGSGYLPQGEDDLYHTQDDEYLAGTGEVAAMSYFSGSTLEKSKFPYKVLAFSPCFRREAGSHGKDTKGLMRVHEFYKLEQVVLCEASHEESVKWHEWLERNVEEFIESLGIPYRTVINCSGDLGLGQVKKYDLELWVPSEKKYREISSASYFHDFQTRRLNIKYKDTDGKSRFAHSLNCTALPTPRILIALLENNQQADGSIKIPKVLAPYLGKEVIESKR